MAYKQEIATLKASIAEYELLLTSLSSFDQSSMNEQSGAIVDAVRSGGVVCSKIHNLNQRMQGGGSKDDILAIPGVLGKSDDDD